MIINITSLAYELTASPRANTRNDTLPYPDHALLTGRLRRCSWERFRAAGRGRRGRHRQYCGTRRRLRAAACRTRVHTNSRQRAGRCRGCTGNAGGARCGGRSPDEFRARRDKLQDASRLRHRSLASFRAESKVCCKSQAISYKLQAASCQLQKLQAVNSHIKTKLAFSGR